MMSGWRERQVEVEKDFRRAGRATQANRRYLVLRGVATAHVSVCSMKCSQQLLCANDKQAVVASMKWAVSTMRKKRT
jgi:hypothetical protein